MRIQIRRISGGVGSVPDAAANSTACGFLAAAASGTAGNQPLHRTRNASNRVCGALELDGIILRASVS
jgi:hypothetical protein